MNVKDLDGNYYNLNLVGNIVKSSSEHKFHGHH